MNEEGRDDDKKLDGGSGCLCVGSCLTAVLCLRPDPASAQVGPGWTGSAGSALPDSVSTVFVTDTVPGFGAVGGVATDALGYVYVADFRNAVWRYSYGWLRSPAAEDFGAAPPGRFRTGGW